MSEIYIFTERSRISVYWSFKGLKLFISTCMYKYTLWCHVPVMYKYTYNNYKTCCVRHIFPMFMVLNGSCD